MVEAALSGTVGSDSSAKEVAVSKSASNVRKHGRK